MSERRSTSCYRDARTAELVVESPVVVYPQVAQRLAGFVADAAWNQYPADPDGVRRRLADVLGAREDLVRLCSGSSESLQALTVATLLLGGSVAYPGDVFSGYTDHLDTPVRDRHSDALLDYGHGLNAPRLTAWLAEDDLSRPRVCFVCCPEVPVGLGTDAVVARVETLAREHPSVHFVLDAAYVEWSLLPAVVATAARHPRVSVAATCSKLIGLAGLRLGVTVLAEMTAAEVGHGQLRFPLSSLQVAAWDALLDDLPSPSQLRLAHRDELHR
ncbi:MAG: aminotransferase class I/II-fold pyridoxal phosphate-dependent enzyme, partial [Nocardioides sp.]|nr:aminotransferase class I/II-fold pyridoxal phosphate-dependent enzyme [Nocardioides sp.]